MIYIIDTPVLCIPYYVNPGYYTLYTVQSNY